MVKYELRFDDWAVEHTPYHVGFRHEDKDGVEVTPYDWDEDGNVIAVKYHRYWIRTKWRDAPRKYGVYEDVQKHTELWECHEQYKRRIW